MLSNRRREICCDGFFGAERVEAVPGVAKQSAAHGIARALEQIVLARGNAGDLHFAFAFEFGSAGKVGFSRTSASRSRPVAKSLLNTSAFTPKLWLPP